MNADSSNKRPAEQFRGEMDDITFSEKDAHHVRHPHCDALVIKAMIANDNIHMILVDNGSSLDILYYQAFERMGLKVSNLKPSPNPLQIHKGFCHPLGGNLSSDDLGRVP